jgi:hypothetical protein
VAEVEEPGLGAIVTIDYGFERGGSIRTGIYLHMADGWTTHPGGETVTWAYLLDLDRVNAELCEHRRVKGAVHGLLITVLACASEEVLDLYATDTGITPEPLPAVIERWCCSPQKSCGNTTLHLVDNGSPAGWPPLYAYVRSNDDSYTGWRTEDEMRAWLVETSGQVKPEAGEPNPYND